MGKSFHQLGTVNENVLESDFEPLCDGYHHRGIAHQWWTKYTDQVLE